MTLWRDPCHRGSLLNLGGYETWQIIHTSLRDNRLFMYIQTSPVSEIGAELFLLWFVMNTVNTSAERSGRAVWAMNELPSAPQTLESQAGISLEAWMSACVFSVYVVLCIGSGVKTSWSPVQGALTVVTGLRNWTRDQCPIRDCREIIIILKMSPGVVNKQRAPETSGASHWPRLQKMHKTHTTSTSKRPDFSKWTTSILPDDSNGRNRLN
jgi:hypothetical protein